MFALSILLDRTVPYVSVMTRMFLLQNILDKFNPGARQMINAGKAYLKALHGTVANTAVVASL